MTWSGLIQKLEEQVEELTEIVSKLLEKESVDRQTKRQASTCILNGNGELTRLLSCERKEFIIHKIGPV